MPKGPETSGRKKALAAGAALAAVTAAVPLLTHHSENADAKKPATAHQETVARDAGVEKIRDGSGRAIRFVVAADAGAFHEDKLKQSDSETEQRILDDINDALARESKYKLMPPTFSHAGGPFDTKFFRLDIYLKSDYPGLPLAEITAHAEDGTVSVFFQNLSRSAGSYNESVKEEIYAVEPYKTTALLREIDDMQRNFDEEQRRVRDRHESEWGGKTVYTMTDEERKRFYASGREEDEIVKKWERTMNVA